MRNLLVIFILFINICNFYPEPIIKILILPFQNNSENKNNEKLYSKLINDTIKSNLLLVPAKIDSEIFEKIILKKLKRNEDFKQKILKYYKKDIFEEFYIKESNLTSEELIDIEKIFDSIKFKKFVPYFLDDLDISIKEIDNSELNDIYKKAVFKGIDLIITGFYIIHENKIRITFKVIDVDSQRAKLIYNNSGDAGYNTFDVILNSTLEFIKKINEKLKPYPLDLNRGLKYKQSRIILKDKREGFLFFNIGVRYSGTASFNLFESKIEKDFHLKSIHNIYSNSVNPFFNLELYKNYKSNYYGFGFNFAVPFIFFVPNMNSSSNIGVSFIFGYKKRFYFFWSIKFLYFQLNKFDDEGRSHNSAVYMGIGTGFTFRYFPENYKYYIETGVLLVPPYMPFYSPGDNSSPSFWNISSGAANYQSWIVPIIPHFAFGYFFKDDIGIYVKTILYFMYITYKSKDYNNDSYDYYGDDFNFTYNIEIGIVIKSIFK